MPRFSASTVALVLLMALLSCRSPDGGRASTAASAPSVPVLAPSAKGVSPGSAPAKDTLLAERLLGTGCAIDGAGEAWCWSDPRPIRDARDGSRPIPARVPELDHARQWVRTSYFTYILRPDEKVYVWAPHPHPYLGDVTKPKPLPGIESVRALAAHGGFVASALTESGVVMSWSDWFESEEPGEPGTIHSDRPKVSAKGVRSLETPTVETSISESGAVHTGFGPRAVKVEGLRQPKLVVDCNSAACALSSDGRIDCWNDRTAKTPPINTFPLGGPRAIVALGCSLLADIYALQDEGTVWRHEFFDGTELVRIPTLSSVVQLAMCDGSIKCPHCVRRRDSTVACWGKDEKRRLGTGEWPKDPQPIVLRKNVDLSAPLTAE